MKQDILNNKRHIKWTIVALCLLVLWNIYKFIIGDFLIGSIMLPINIFSAVLSYRNWKKANEQLAKAEAIEKLMDSSQVFDEDAFEQLCEDD